MRPLALLTHLPSAIQAWRLLRRQSPALTLLIALCFALAEPVACLIHCHLIVPLFLHSAQAHPPYAALLSQGTGLLPRSGVPIPQSEQWSTFFASGMPWPTPSDHLCSYAPNQDDSLPVPLPLSLDHERMLVSSLALIILALAYRHYLPALRPGPAVCLAPLTPPPKAHGVPCRSCVGSA